ncbi:hypothetical protein GCM10010990_22360 [Croceicoccus mobilis]|uniref:Uncharacterized protein n=1 Tax=Croceicoccus mobilis TaxID=1703339 RepID=A0A916Z370_9SPHN|nr:hypothetical protein GCM10010990_22360 [Croceicoccus mobilis]
MGKGDRVSVCIRASPCNRDGQLLRTRLSPQSAPREGPDVVNGCLSDNAGAKDTAQLIERAGRRSALVKGDIA